VNLVLFVIKLFFLGYLKKRIHICMIHTRKHIQKFCIDGIFWMPGHRYWLIISSEILCVKWDAFYQY